MKPIKKVKSTLERSSNVDIKIDHGRSKRIHLDLAFKELLQLIIGGLIVAFAVAVFTAPHDIAPGGATGAAVIVHNFVRIPIGILMLLFNIPAFVLGYRTLGGGSFLIRSLVGTLVYNLSVDWIGTYVPPSGVTEEMILNAIFGGIIGGLGVGLIYRAGGVAGAGGVLTRLLRQRLGWPMSTIKMITNGLVVTAAGFVFGWEAALFAIISFFVSGAAADFVLDGPDVVQTALIITDYPQRMIEAVSRDLHRGVTKWPVEGNRYLHPHAALFVTVARPQMNALKNIVAATDDQAFMVLMQGHEAIGKGFKAHRDDPPIVEEVNETEAR